MRAEALEQTATQLHALLAYAESPRTEAAILWRNLEGLMGASFKREWGSQGASIIQAVGEAEFSCIGLDDLPLLDRVVFAMASKLLESDTSYQSKILDLLKDALGSLSDLPSSCSPHVEFR